MLIEDIRTQRMAAMKARDAVTKTLLTTLLGELESIAKRIQCDITDDMVVKAAKKFISGNDEVIEAGAKVGVECPNLVAENVLLETFIPKQLTEDELRAIIVEMDGSNLGEIMQQLKAKYDGIYDGKLASIIAREVLA